MSFLAPWFFLGALAIAGPIIFHLIRRATRDRVQFSATQFLSASPPRLQKKSSLQHIWLLLLRCLILLLLAFGFSRPFFDKEIPVLPEGTQVQHTVLILDESASMQRGGHWEAAKTQLSNWVEENGLDHRLSILGVSDRVSHILPDELWEKTPKNERQSLLNGILAGREPSWGASYLDSGINAAIDELEQLAENSDLDAIKTVRIFSDLTSGARLAGLAGRDWPDDCVVEFESTVSSGESNVGIQWLGWSKIGDGPRKARLSLITTGENQNVTLKAVDAITGDTVGEPQSIFSQVDDRRLFLLDIPDEQTNPFLIQVEGDAEEFDNTLYVAPENIRTVDVLVVGNAEANDSKDSLFYILRSTEGLEDPVVEVGPIEGGDWVNSEDLLLTLLDQPSTAELSQISQFLSNGGSALLLFKDNKMLDTIRSLTGDSGWQSPALTRDYGLLGTIDFEHPVFKIFADPRYNNFANVRFWEPHALEPPAGSDARILAKFDEGPAAIIEVPVGSGKLIVWGGDWTPQAGQWVLSSKFVPWFQQLIETSIGGPSLPTMAFVNEPNRLTGGDEVTWLDPNGETLAEAPQSPGLYQLNKEGQSIWVAVNMHHEESRIAPLPFDTWEKLGVPLEPSKLIVPESLNEERAAAKNAIELEGEQKLWRWLLIATAFILAIESIVSITQSRRGAATAEA